MWCSVHEWIDLIFGWKQQGTLAQRGKGVPCCVPLYVLVLSVFSGVQCVQDVRFVVGHSGHLFRHYVRLIGENKLHLHRFTLVHRLVHAHNNTQIHMKEYLSGRRRWLHSTSSTT